MKYTLKLHRHRLRLMLKRDNACDLCPGRKGFWGDGTEWIGNEKGDPGKFRRIIKGPCIVCQGFVGVINGCPCNALGDKEAIKRTLLKLEEDV